MKRIAIVTATRAEYGLLAPLIQRIQEDQDCQLDLIVTGTHLSEKYGYTIDAIEADGFPITHKIPILEEKNTPYDISHTMANAIKGFGACFRDDRPDMIVILGDRTEMLGVAVAALNERIPIAHIHGGEVTEGAVDDCIRHALTKMSYLHFTSTEVYRSRVIQLGESPQRVFNVGSLGTENILNMPLMCENEIRQAIGITYHQPYVVTTFHPVTLEGATAKKQVQELCQAMGERKDFFYVITRANADAGGDVINDTLEQYADGKPNVKMVSSLGTIRYLSAMKYASFVLGNSSSGIIEAPVLGTPTVNIGDRQKGRMLERTIINCHPYQESIVQAMEKAEKMPHIQSRAFGEGNTSVLIIDILKDFLFKDKINLKKSFYDLERTN